MKSPKLFMHTRDPLLASALLGLSGVRQFELAISNQADSWLDQLAQSGSQVAIVEVDSLADSALASLEQSPLLHSVEFLFFSRGEPDPVLDLLMNKGAGFHYRAPFNYDLVNASLEESYKELAVKTHTTAGRASYLDQFCLLLGSSAAMHSLYSTIRKVAVTKANAFIVGESGAGKELVANSLHVFSERSDKPFVAVNCGALSPELIDSELFGHVKGAFTGAHKDHIGVFEQAKGGTLFLDEITEMPYEHQVKLLRVLECGEYKPVGSQNIKIADVRVIAATNRLPQEAIAEEVFREDLYFRLAQFPIDVPPLRERDDDACGLAQHFITYRNKQENTHKQLSEAALDKIRHYPWPGNVRELKHAIERAYIMADDIITPCDLVMHGASAQSVDPSSTVPQGMRLDDLEKIAITQTLKHNAGNKTDTAQQLGISVKTLYNKLDKYDASTPAA